MVLSSGEGRFGSEGLVSMGVWAADPDEPVLGVTTFGILAGAFPLLLFGL